MHITDLFRLHPSSGPPFLKITPVPFLSGPLIIEPTIHRDDRGYFLESWRASDLADASIDVHFVQDNHSRSVRGVVRGLHYQKSPGMPKLVRCSVGRVWDVIVDIRRDSPTFGQWAGVELDGESHRMIFVPIGFAHGFAVLSDFADVQYKCGSTYNPATEGGILWNDPDLAIDWKVTSPTLSPRDEKLPRFREGIPV
jgi:dTDP-4-dehydrorhamnose 3,5-epimerase